MDCLGPVTRADAVVVLGGNIQERPLVAAELYRRGLADKILVSQMPETGHAATKPMGAPTADFRSTGFRSMTADELAPTTQACSSANRVCDGEVDITTINEVVGRP